MFALVMRFTLKPGSWSAWEEFDRRWETQQAPKAPGFKGSYILREKSAPDRCIMVVLFESEQMARQNSQRPETNQWYQEALQLTEGEIEFIDTDVVKWYLL